MASAVTSRSEQEHVAHITALVRAGRLRYEAAQEILKAIHILLQRAPDTAEPGKRIRPPGVSELAWQQARFVIGDIDQKEFTAPWRQLVARAGIGFGLIVGLGIGLIPMVTKLLLDQPVPTSVIVGFGAALAVAGGVAAGWLWTKWTFYLAFRRPSNHLVSTIQVDADGPRQDES